MLHIILTVIAFVIIFSLLVLIHEWGHFFAARKSGVKVEEFGIGLPPRIKRLKKDKKGTEYTLNWIPIGGFVRMYGEEDYKVSKHPESFAAKSIWKRMIIVLAGVFMNFFLAYILLTIGYSAGMEPIILPHEVEAAMEDGRLNAWVEISSVESLSNAELAGFQPGDKVINLNNQEVENLNEIKEILDGNTASEVSYTVLRNGEEQTFTVELNEKGKSGLTLQQNIQSVPEQYPPHIAAGVALKETGRLSVETVKFAASFFGQIITRAELQEGVGGPVRIAAMTHELVGLGDLMIILQFTALLSLSLAVVNLMPIPALDGGRFIFLVVELIVRKPVNRKIEIMIHHIGFFALLVLILAITYRDIVSIIP